MITFILAAATAGSIVLGVAGAAAQAADAPATAHVAQMPDHIDRSHRVRLADSPADRCPEPSRSTVRAEQAFIDTYSEQVERTMKQREMVKPLADAKLGLELQGVVADDAFAIVVRRTNNDVPRSRIADLILCSGLTGGTSKQARAIGLYAPAGGGAALLYSPYIGLYVLSI